MNFYKSTKDQLVHYSKYFNSVEINCTSYHKITKKMCENWYNETPPNFIFTIKMAQYITNYKKLNDFGDYWSEFFPIISTLKNKLGVLLFLFNERFHKTPKNFEKLREIKHIIPDTQKCAFEFRHNSWYELDENTLFSGNWTIAITHTTGKFGNLKNGFHFSDNSESNFVYIRLHGTLDYSSGSYGPEKLQEILDTFTDDRELYMYSNTTDSWEIFDYETKMNEILRHVPNTHYILAMILGKSGFVPINKPIIPSAIYDMLIVNKLC